MSDPEIQAIAKANGVSAATILLSYHVNKGVVALPKSTTESRISSNKQMITLSSGDIATLDNLAANGKAQSV
jgi:glycerol 2-dehydrogenase (NADP+)